ncbi:hypothetical protein [Rothia aeria]
MSASVFPAYVGMSPGGQVAAVAGAGVPRIRGDEPVSHRIEVDLI